MLHFRIEHQHDLVLLQCKNHNVIICNNKHEIYINSKKFNCSILYRIKEKSMK